MKINYLVKTIKIAKSNKQNSIVIDWNVYKWNSSAGALINIC